MTKKKQPARTAQEAPARSSRVQPETEQVKQPQRRQAAAKVGAPKVAEPAKPLETAAATPTPEPVRKRAAPARRATVAGLELVPGEPSLALTAIAVRGRAAADAVAAVQAPVLMKPVLGEFDSLIADVSDALEVAGYDNERSPRHPRYLAHMLAAQAWQVSDFDVRCVHRRGAYSVYAARGGERTGHLLAIVGDAPAPEQLAGREPDLHQDRQEEASSEVPRMRLWLLPPDSVSADEIVAMVPVARSA
jgi:hypothetical protein